MQCMFCAESTAVIQSLLGDWLCRPCWTELEKRERQRREEEYESA